jgi:hypothetical protein
VSSPYVSYFIPSFKTVCVSLQEDRVIELKSVFQFIMLGRNLGTRNIARARLHNASKFPAIHMTHG